MKKIKYLLFSGLLTFAVMSCNDMDLEPKGLLDKNALFGTEAGIQKYFTGIYSYLPIEDFVYHPEKGFRWDNYWENSMTLASMSGEMSGQFWGVAGAQGFGYWPYDRIREINELLRDFPAFESQYTPATYNAILGEAHCLRAFYYFSLVKRYGGIPIIKEVQDPLASVETLQVPRDKEADVYKFIQQDLDFAMQNLPAKSDRGRVNKYVAAALMSRSMLYAGSIAKYGPVTGFTGEAVEKSLVGIPTTEAEWFFQQSYDASKLVEEGGYSLYNANSDKVQNYVDLFLDLNSKEDIFVKEYSITAPHNNRLKHSYDATHLPNPDFSSDNEAAAYPILDVVELFEKLPIVNDDNTPRRFKTVEEMYANLEPRMLATFYFPGMELRGKKFDIQRGLYLNYDGTVADAQEGSTGASINSESNRILGGPKNSQFDYAGTKFNITGQHGMWKDGHANNTRTGFFIRKYINYKMQTSEVKLYNSSQPWKIFRYAEILLNRAEAAYELGLIKGDNSLKQEAFTYIAAIRDRAGAKPYAYNAAPTDLSSKYGYALDSNLQFIRDERERELCYENHHWWDMRRWRVADAELRQFVPKSLMPYLVLDEIKYENGKRVNSYIFLCEREPWNKTFNFEKKWYYEPIPGGELNKNQNLYPQNPIY